MLKVVAFMRQVANGLQMGGNFGTAHVYRSSLNAIIVYCGKGDFTFDKVTPGWLKGFEIHLRSRVVVGIQFQLICAHFVQSIIVRSIFEKHLMCRICSIRFIPVLALTVSELYVRKT